MLYSFRSDTLEYKRVSPVLVESIGLVLALVDMPAPVCEDNSRYFPADLVTCIMGIHGVIVSTVVNCGAVTDIEAGNLWLALLLADAPSTFDRFFLFLSDRLICADVDPKI